MTGETKVCGEKHVPTSFCLPRIVHTVAGWWQRENSIVSNGGKEKIQLSVMVAK